MCKNHANLTSYSYKTKSHSLEDERSNASWFSLPRLNLIPQLSEIAIFNYLKYVIVIHVRDQNLFLYMAGMKTMISKRSTWNLRVRIHERCSILTFHPKYFSGFCRADTSWPKIIARAICSFTGPGIGFIEVLVFVHILCTSMDVRWALQGRFSNVIRIFVTDTLYLSRLSWSYIIPARNPQVGKNVPSLTKVSHPELNPNQKNK